MLDCQLYGLQPWGHHLTNILCCTDSAAILLFLALLQLTNTGAGIGDGGRDQRSRLQVSTSNVWPCAFVAALFAIHPLRVESVAWISERKDVLSGVFFMLTLLAYASYSRSERHSVGKYTTVVVLFAFGLLCKPTLVTFPFVLLLLDYWPLGRFTSQRWSIVRGLVVEKIPLFILSAVSCVVTVFAQRKAFDTDLSLTLAQRVGNVLVSYVTYIGQMIYPVRLAVLYPYGQLKIPLVILGIVFVLTISAVFLMYRRKYPFLPIGWFWYLGVLVPMIGVVQVGLQPRADRYTYLSQIGLYIVVVWGVATLIADRAWRRVVATILGLLTVIASG